MSVPPQKPVQPPIAARAAVIATPTDFSAAGHLRGAARLIIGAGQFGRVTLSEAAAAYFKRNGCQVELLPTPEAIPVWNAAAGAVIGLLHVTC